MAAVAALNESAQKILPWYNRRKLKPGGADQVAANVARDAKGLLPFLDLRFQNEAKQKKIKKKLRRWGNFKKLIESFSKVKDGAELLALAEKMDTKSKDAWEKYRDLRDWIVGLVKAFDVEVERTIDVGPWSVRLMSHPRYDWDNDATQKLAWIIRQTVRDLNGAGLGKAVGGRMQAWATPTVPISGAGGQHTAASYNPRLDLTRLAVDGKAPLIVRTLIHELGHRFYFKIMGSRGREAWRAFFGENVGKPDLSKVMRMWEEFAAKEKFGEWSPYFAQHLKKVDPDQLMWLEIASRAVGLDEEFDPLTGQPRRKKKNRPGLEVVKEALPKLEVFLHPVTAYSTSHPDELFAETFSYIVVDGPRRVPAIVRYAFKQAVPQARIASAR